MREIQVEGNLADAPQILTGTDGSNYVRFRIGNHEFGDAENETKWFSVVMFSVPTIIQHLKKGSCVRVYGKYKDSIYENEKYGPQIDRSIVASLIDFGKFSGNGNKENADGAQAQTAPATTPAASPAEAPKASTPKRKTTKAPATAPAPAPAPTYEASADDDLPF